MIKYFLGKSQARKTAWHNSQLAAAAMRGYKLIAEVLTVAPGVGYASTGPLSYLANERPTNAEMLIGLANEITQTNDGWVQLSPYGDFPHEKGIQQFDHSAAVELVNNWNGLAAKLARLFVGNPFFIGHPDLPNSRDKYPDTKAYGWIKEVEARDDGLYGKVDWSKAGLEILENAYYKFLSPNFGGRVIGTREGKTLYRPVWLFSAGFTNNPNLPVAPLANEATDNNGVTGENEMNEEQLNALRKLLRLANDAAPAVILAKLQKIQERLANESPLAGKLSAALGAINKTPAEFAAAIGVDEATALGILDGTIPQPSEEVLAKAATFLNVPLDELKALLGSSDAAAQVDTLQNELTQTRASLANERSARIDLELEKAKNRGIAVAQIPFWKSRLAGATDFSAELVKLQNEKPAVKTQSTTTGLDHRTASGNPSMEFTALVNERVGKGVPFNDAWQQVKKDRADLFEAMEAAGKAA